MSNFSKVLVWEEEVIIPTYEVGKPDRNPLFLEKRVYQGSSGKVYPHPVIEKIYDNKVNKKYKGLFLENDFIKIMILPELGGRVQRAFDKKRNYDFVYYNEVIKPALVGLAGPWLSGGIEFNWPQHHRPSTFDQVNYEYFENDDGSASIICSEIENMFHTKAVIEFKLYPNKAYIELNNTLYNRTNINQAFLWWANPAVSVNKDYSSVFPLDVNTVMDHAKRGTVDFPIAHGTYYSVDYSKGVDIRKYCNLPAPTSYMAAKSNFDFLGGYDYGVKAGILHVADHHVSPGKKQWTWGCGEFGIGWDRNLTDKNGPYFELMTGCFTDNQPDFSYIGPMETRHFAQYFMPYHDLGQIHNATKDLSVHIDVGEKIIAKFYCSGELGECQIELNGQKKDFVFECGNTYDIEFENTGITFDDIDLKVTKDGLDILSFAGNYERQPVPEAAKAAPYPEECKTLEDLYLYGLHVEQYRHATRRAENYYLEGLKRDPTDIRLNLAYGTLLLKKGCFEEATKYLEKAIEKENRSNPNFISGNSNYYLGLAYFYCGQLDKAFDRFYKAIWNFDTKAIALFFLAAIKARQNRLYEALSFIDAALIYNTENNNALILKALILKHLGKEYYTTIESALKADKFNLLARYLKGEDIQKHIINPNMLIDLSIECAVGGFNDEALNLLSLSPKEFPMVEYYKAYYTQDDKYLKAAIGINPDCCFPNRLEDIIVLKYAIKNNPNDFKAHYYLGNLFYDKERHGDAILEFKKSIELGADFATPYRNLALLSFNILHNKEEAYNLMEKAYSIDESDSRVLYEFDLLKKRMGVNPNERLAFLEKHMDVTSERDALYLEYITLLNIDEQYEKALSLIMGRHFHPWEGGEGKVTEQYIFSNCAIGKEDNLRNSYSLPLNLGEGKVYKAQENRQDYLLGVLLNDKELLEKASTGICEPTSQVYYNDQPPETIFYQGLALQKLGNNKEADLRFTKLIEYADKHYEDKIELEYFAISLPELLVFDDDLQVKNKIHCTFMKALGLYGKGNIKESKKLFEKILSINPSIFSVATHYNLLFETKKEKNS